MIIFLIAKNIRKKIVESKIFHIDRVLYQLDSLIVKETSNIV